MGHEQSKSKKTINTKHMDNNKLNVILKQIYFTAQLYKDRRKGQQNMREKELLNLFREPANRRVKENEYQKAAAIVNDIKWIKAFEYVMRYADLLKDNETVIQMSKGNTANISELIPYVESLIWGCQKGNIDCIKAFQDYICLAFGPETYNQLCTFTRVTPELKECFANVLPTEKEVKLYLIDFCNRNGVTLESMNEIGHSLSLSAPADFPDSNTQFQAPPLDTQTQQTQTSGYPNYPGNFQQGYPQPPNNFPGQGGNFPQSGFPQGGFPQGGDGSQHGSGFPQGGYPQGGNGSQQGGFPQGGFPQGGDGSQHGSGFPQGGYTQGGFPQDSNQQGGFPQKGMSLGGSYAQRGVQYPQFSDYPPSNFNANPLEPYKQAPLGGIQGPSGNSNLNMEVREMSFGQQGQPEQPGSGMGGFPNFQKFGGPGGQMGSGDPLDELDQRLRNIKGGL